MKGNKIRVVVTGIGCVSSYGLGVQAFWNGILSGKSNLKKTTRFNGAVYRSGLAAEVPREVYDDVDLRRLCNNPLEDSALLASIAALEAVDDAGFTRETFALRADETGCVLGSLCAGGREFEAYGRAYVRSEQSEQKYVGDIEATHVHYQLDHLIDLLGTSGPSTMISTACSSSTDAIGYAGDIIRAGDAKMMIAGGADILAEIVHAGFNGVLSITRSYPKPFTPERDGFFIGEGAGILILEELDSALQRGAKIYAELRGYGLSNTAFHLTATSDSGRGEALSVERALADSNLSPEDVDHVNAHGTSTQHNDQTELLALEHVFQGSIGQIKVNTIKPMIGHCMGAAGAMEAIATLLAIHYQTIPATINSNPEAGKIKFDLVVGAPRKVKIRHAISQSFGFGGACSSVVFGRLQQEL